MTEPTRAELLAAASVALTEAATAWWEVRGAEGIPALKRTKKKAWAALEVYGAACQALGEHIGRQATLTQMGWRDTRIEEVAYWTRARPGRKAGGRGE